MPKPNGEFKPHDIQKTTLEVYYRLQRSCGKVIFSQASVKNSVHGGGSRMAGQGCWGMAGVCMVGYTWQGVSMVWACMAGGIHSRGHVWQGGICGRGVCVVGVCMARGMGGGGEGHV